jgi:hypothetical protein
MTPTVGRIVHVKSSIDPSIPCRAALITGVDYNPLRIFAAVFRNRGDLDRSVITGDDWHDPKECPDTTEF